MIRLFGLFFTAIILLLVSGCAESPIEAGKNMAEAHLELGFNLTPSEKAEMQSEVDEKVANYTLIEMQEFMLAYLETLVDESPEMILLQGKALEKLSKAMQGINR